MNLQLVIFVYFLQYVQALQIRTFLPPIVLMLTTPDQASVSACPSMFPSSALSVCPSVCPSLKSTLFTVSSTLSLDIYQTLSLSSQSSQKVAASSHPIITLPKILNLITYKGLVKKFAKKNSVRQCLTINSPCFSLSSTQKNLIPMCIYLLGHDFFRFLAIFSASSLYFHKMFVFVGYPCASSNYPYQMLYMEDTRYSLLSLIFLKLYN